MPDRSQKLRLENITWHGQNEPGKNKISFDFQIPADLEVFGCMLLHAAINPSVKRTLDNIQKSTRKPGAFKSNSDSINAYMVIDSPAIDAYDVMVKQDRQSTIGMIKKRIQTTSSDDVAADETENQIRQQNNFNRRWITALRLYCAIDGYLPHVAQGKWKSLVTHYKLKVRYTLPYTSIVFPSVPMKLTYLYCS